MIVMDYFEGICSQRGIAWRCSDSRSLAESLGVPVMESTLDHSSMTRTNARVPLDVHEQVLQFVLSIAHAKDLIAAPS